MQAILERMPATLWLMGLSAIVSVTVGISAGMFSAVKPYSIADYLITTLAFFGQSMPVFWFALMLQLLFAVHGITFGDYIIKLPSAGMAELDTFNIGDRIEHVILPTIVLSLLSLALYSRFMRSSLLEVMKTDYIRTAAAKGVGFWSILFKHATKNAMIPVVTVVALSLPGILGGAIVTETIFAWPGMGRMFYNALQQGDIALMMGYITILSTLIVFCNLLADVTYAWLDPRVKYN
jgi:peptide/nickel transport system permease protein